MNKLILVAPWAIVMLLCPVLVTAAEAEDERFWVRMNPNRFESTPESAAEQCARVVALHNSSVTEESCEALKVMLDEGKCEVAVPVPDGIRLDLMSTYEGGRPTVVGPMTKKLGRDDDRATVCNVGDGITAYFFVGEERSCGNLAFVVERPEVEMVAAASTDSVSPPAKEKCRWVKEPTVTSTSFVSTTLMSSGISTGCGFVLIGGGVVVTTELPQSSFTSSRRVCDD